ncbi:hypothetical protein ACSS6W_002516 [Trichoderma asperelloides]
MDTELPMLIVNSQPPISQVSQKAVCLTQKKRWYKRQQEKEPSYRLVAQMLVEQDLSVVTPFFFTRADGI